MWRKDTFSIPRGEKIHSRGEETHSHEEETYSREEETHSREEETHSREEETHSREEETHSRGEETRSRGEETFHLNDSERLPEGLKRRSFLGSAPAASRRLFGLWILNSGFRHPLS